LVGLSLLLPSQFSFVLDLGNRYEIVQELRMLVVEPARLGQMGPLEQFADCVEPQGLMQAALDGLLVEECLGLSL
jgi:hypothetical protein